MVFNGYEPGEGSMRKFVEGFCGDREWDVMVEVFCRLSKGGRGVFDGWGLVINSVLKERAKLEKAPGSGELVVIGADAAKPYLVLGIISADGKKLRHKVDLKLNRSIICHDTSVTNMYNI
ncbi:uncharacterized protein A4U43_UnF10600 [Asparagus officinalis]|uniref:Uncharacterized protein n=1 Tax=Asparagus officinalis TaxID=4686 RepID=A0A1R3L5G4_ASPOF|nr:uncharacterized protein A4U43_UnF10600 [Asparagus officinalis]